MLWSGKFCQFYNIGWFTKLPHYTAHSDKPACLHLSYLLIKTDVAHSCLWLNLCFSRTGLCPLCNLNCKWLCAACSRKLQSCFVSKSCDDHLAITFASKCYFDYLLLWLPFYDDMVTSSCSHVFVSKVLRSTYYLMLFFCNPVYFPPFQILRPLSYKNLVFIMFNADLLNPALGNPCIQIKKFALI